MMGVLDADFTIRIIYEDTVYSDFNSYWICDFQIFSPVGYSFILLIVSFDAQKLLLDMSNDLHSLLVILPHSIFLYYCPFSMKHPVF